VPAIVDDLFDVTYLSHNHSCTIADLQNIEPELTVIYPALGGTSDRQFRVSLREAITGLPIGLVRIKRFSHRASGCAYAAEEYCGPHGLQPALPVIWGTQWYEWFPGELENAISTADISWIGPYLVF
jgi:hypothetical protein